MYTYIYIYILLTSRFPALFSKTLHKCLVGVLFSVKLNRTISGFI